MSRFFERAFEIVMRPDIIGTMLRASETPTIAPYKSPLFARQQRGSRVPRQD